MQYGWQWDEFGVLIFSQSVKTIDKVLLDRWLAPVRRIVPSLDQLTHVTCPPPPPSPLPVLFFATEKPKSRKIFGTGQYASLGVSYI